MKQLSTLHRSPSIRQPAVVSASAAVAVVGAFIGSGAAGGTEIQKASGGALAADATLLAPHGPAFAIWSLIYVGLLAYSVWQFLPGQRGGLRHRRLGYPVAASLLLNAAWILSIQCDLLWLSVPIIIVLLAVLVWIFAVLRKIPPVSKADAVITDGTLGLYLGWVVVATAANIAAWTVSMGWRGLGISPTLWAIAALALTVAVGVLLALVGSGRLAPAAAMVWGLSWLAAARLTGELHSAAVAVTAIIGIAVIAAATFAARLRARG